MLAGANLATQYAAAELMCDVPLPSRSPQQQQQNAACMQKVSTPASVANAPWPHSSQRCAWQVDLRQRLVVLAAAETKQASAGTQAEEYITVSPHTSTTTLTQLCTCLVGSPAWLPEG